MLICLANFRFPMASQESSDTIDRKWARYPVDRDPVSISNREAGIEGVIVDESIGGLGIETSVDSPLIVGEHVDVQYRGIVSEAQVAGMSSGISRLSVRWRDLYRDEAVRSYRPFVSIQSVSVACRSLNRSEGQQVAAELWDGKEFRVPASKIRFQSKAERVAELNSLGDACKILLAIYQLGNVSDLREVIDRVIEFEFAADFNVE